MGWQAATQENLRRVDSLARADFPSRESTIFPPSRLSCPVITALRVLSHSDLFGVSCVVLS